MARLIPVIVCEDRRGAGNPGGPVRQVTQFWTPEGELLAEVDPWPPGRGEPGGGVRTGR